METLDRMLWGSGSGVISTVTTVIRLRFKFRFWEFIGLIIGCFLPHLTYIAEKDTRRWIWRCNLPFFFHCVWHLWIYGSKYKILNNEIVTRLNTWKH